MSDHPALIPSERIRVGSGPRLAERRAPALWIGMASALAYPGDARRLVSAATALGMRVESFAMPGPGCGPAPGSAGPTDLFHGTCGETHAFARANPGLLADERPLRRSAWYHLVDPDLMAPFRGFATVGLLRRRPSADAVFVAPDAQDKPWDAHVAIPGRTALRIPASEPDDAIVALHDPIAIRAEHRLFVAAGRGIVSSAPYAGTDDAAADPPDQAVVAALVAALAPLLDRLPVVAVDIGVRADGRTILVECNGPYASGLYGADAVPILRAMRAWTDA